MASKKIVLFDLPSKAPNHAWSMNTWKTRLLLNYKKLDYETEWLEYPDIKPRLQPHFPADQEKFTLPTVILPDGRYIMDSAKIAEEIEKLYPEPSIHLGTPQQDKYLAKLEPCTSALRPIYVPWVCKRLLNEVNYPYWRRTREAGLDGLSLEEFETQHGGQKAYDAAAPHLRELSALLRENDRGPFFLGDVVSYTDLVHASFLLMMRRLGEDVWKGILHATGDAEVHLQLLEALGPFIERDDY